MQSDSLLIFCMSFSFLYCKTFQLTIFQSFDIFALMPVSRQHFTAYSNFTVQVQRIKSTEMTEIQNWLHFMSFSHLIKSYLFNKGLPQRKRERERNVRYESFCHLRVNEC